MAALTPIPEIGSRWLHENGSTYVVYDVTNLNTTQPEEYPVMVSYFDEKTGEQWSKNLHGFLARRTKLDGVRPDKKETFYELTIMNARSFILDRFFSNGLSLEEFAKMADGIDRAFGDAKELAKKQMDIVYRSDR